MMEKRGGGQILVAWESNQSYWAVTGLPYNAGVVLTPKFTVAQLTHRTI